MIGREDQAIGLVAADRTGKRRADEAHDGSSLELAFKARTRYGSNTSNDESPNPISTAPPFRLPTIRTELVPLRLRQLYFSTVYARAIQVESCPARTFKNPGLAPGFLLLHPRRPRETQAQAGKLHRRTVKRHKCEEDAIALLILCKGLSWPGTQMSDLYMEQRCE